MNTKLKNQFNLNLEELIEGYNFQKIHSVMNFLNWNWYGKGIPSIENMKDCIRELYNLAIQESNFDTTFGTGGFSLKLYKDGSIYVWFTVCDYQTI